MGATIIRAVLPTQLALRLGCAALLLCTILLAPAALFSTDSRRVLRALAVVVGGGGGCGDGTQLDTAQPSQLDTAQPSRRFGRQRKHGTLGILTQLHGLQNPQFRVDGYGRGHLDLYPPQWVKERLAGNTREPLYREAGLMVSDRYKLVFVKCTKTAGSLLVRTFSESLCGCKKGTPCGCLSFVNFADPAAIQHALDVWDDYFVFFFARNVYLTRMMDLGCPAPRYEAFCQDPFMLGDICQLKSTEGQPCCLPFAQHHYGHASPQANCFTTLDGQTAVDWIGRVERLEDDLAELVRILNARPGVPKLRRPKHGSLKRFNYNSGLCDKEAPDASSGKTQQQRQQQQPQPAQRRRRQQRRQLYAAAANKQGSSSNKPLPPWAVPEQWEPRNGTINLCDKNQMLRGKYQPCYAAFASFYAEDMRLLHDLSPPLQH
ncbi:hypothetical protein ABPG75_001156 [Micractinium tetrahymenae]